MTGVIEECSVYQLIVHLNRIHTQGINQQRYYIVIKKDKSWWCVRVFFSFLYETNVPWLSLCWQSIVSSVVVVVLDSSCCCLFFIVNVVVLLFL